MKFYEMVFKKPFEDNSRKFYMQNNIKTRTLFLNYLREEIDIELLNFKKSCDHDFFDDLMNLYEQVQKDSHKFLDNLQDKFICEGHAQWDDIICLKVYERTIEDNDKV